jgi:hypothetical protein
VIVDVTKKEELSPYLERLALANQMDVADMLRHWRLYHDNACLLNQNPTARDFERWCGFQSVDSNFATKGFYGDFE